MLQVAAGEVLNVGTAALGARCYIAVAGGFDAPLYLGSRSTFPSGNLGGYQGRALAVGDSCELGSPPETHTAKGSGAASGGGGAVVPEAWRPVLGVEEEGGRVWRVTMLQGPQTAPDYFTEEDMQVRALRELCLLHSAEWLEERSKAHSISIRKYDLHAKRFVLFVSASAGSILKFASPVKRWDVSNHMG